MAGNSCSGGLGTKFSVVRFGNVMESRGSVIPFFMSLQEESSLPITDARMTRFMNSLEQGVDQDWHAFGDMTGREIFVRKIPSMRIMCIAQLVALEKEHTIVGIPPGEKPLKKMIGFDDTPFTYEYDDYYKIVLAKITELSNEAVKGGIKVSEDFVYSTDNNPDWIAPEALPKWIEENRSKIGAI